jgi:hypothetical protein
MHSNFEKYLEKIWNAKYLEWFHSFIAKSFDGLKGNFPIGFLIWKTNILLQIKNITILK